MQEWVAGWSWFVFCLWGPFLPTLFLSISVPLSFLLSHSLPVPRCQGKNIGQMPSGRGRSGGWRGPLCIFCTESFIKVFYTSQKSLSNLGRWMVCESLSRKPKLFLVFSAMFSENPMSELFMPIKSLRITASHCRQNRSEFCYCLKRWTWLVYQLMPR